jgi:putative membrane protein
MFLSVNGTAQSYGGRADPLGQQRVRVVRVRLLLRFAGNVAAVWAAAQLFSGFTYGGRLGTLLAAAAALTLVNWIVRPVVKLLAIPFIVLTLGIGLFFVNLAMLELAAALVHGFKIDGFWTAVGATIVVWAVNALLHLDKRAERRRRAGARWAA